jgi:hypothetical protein
VCCHAQDYEREVALQSGELDDRSRPPRVVDTTGLDRKISTALLMTRTKEAIDAILEEQTGRLKRKRPVEIHLYFGPAFPDAEKPDRAAFTSDDKYKEALAEYKQELNRVYKIHQLYRAHWAKEGSTSFASWSNIVPEPPP